MFAGLQRWRENHPGTAGTALGAEAAHPLISLSLPPGEVPLAQAAGGGAQQGTEGVGEEAAAVGTAEAAGGGAQQGEEAAAPGGAEAPGGAVQQAVEEAAEAQRHYAQAADAAAEGEAAGGVAAEGGAEEEKEAAEEEEEGGKGTEEIPDPSRPFRAPIPHEVHILKSSLSTIYGDSIQ